jgi:integrase/recombinase XerD
LPAEEVASLCAFCLRQEGRRGALLRGLLAVMIGGGIRRDEVCKLGVSDYRNGALRVIGKGNKERRVPLGDDAEGLDEWVSVRKTLSLAHENMFVSIRRDDRVRRVPISTWGLWDLVANVCDDWMSVRRIEISSDDIDSFAPHDLRRTMASLLIDGGTPITTLQKIMGHAKVETTAGYDRRGDKEIEIARKKIRIVT